MKLLVMSDLHLEKRIPVPASGAPMPDFDVLICAGDVFDGDIEQSIQFIREVAGDKPAIFVAGNHEYWGYSVEDVIEKGRAIAQDHANFHFLENESATIGGVTFAGATLWDDGNELHNAAVEYLSSVSADVVVTHFPPPSDLFLRTETMTWICGHEHGHYFREIGGKKFIRNALGYPGQEYLGYIENFVIEVRPKLRPGVGLRTEVLGPLLEDKLGYNTDDPVEAVRRMAADAVAGINQDAVRLETQRIMRHFPPAPSRETVVGASERREALMAYSRGDLTRSECMVRLNMEISDVAAFAALMNSEKIAWPPVDREAAESATDKLLNFLDADQGEKPKPARETTVRSDEDPLGYDTSDPQTAMLQMARDAQSGATKEAVQTELAKVRQTYNAELDPDPADEDNDDETPQVKP